MRATAIAVICTVVSVAFAWPVRAQAAVRGSRPRPTPLERAVESVAPAVVTIESTRQPPRARRFARGRDRRFDFFGDQDAPFRFFVEPHMPRPQMLTPVTGCGVIVDAEGHVLTTNTVVAGAETAEVRLADDRAYTARVVGRDEATNLAVIRIEGKFDEPAVARLGDSDDLRVGQSVLAIGSPFGLRNSVSTGIVSALGRSGVGVADREHLIQTDLSVHPGASGGPLCNMRGEVVGITAAARMGGEFPAGVGFAIPINTAKAVLDDLIAGRAVVRGYLGVYIGDVSPEMAARLDLERARGALVHEVSPDSPAREAGLVAGDVVLEYDGRKVTGPGDLRSRVAATRPGTEVDVKVWRNGSEETLHVTVGRLEPRAAEGQDSLGIDVQELTPQMAENMGEPGLKGVLVADVDADGPAAGKIRPGDVILSVNRQPVGSVERYRDAVADAGGAALLRVLDAETGRKRFVLVSRERGR